MIRSIHVEIAAATLQGLRQVPAGRLYTMLMESTGITLGEFDVLVTELEDAGLISYGRNHLLTWLGPATTMH